MVARVGGFDHHLRQGIDVGAPVGRLDAGFRHFRHLPRNMLRLQEEHFIGAAERRRQIVLADAHFHGVRARLQHGENARGTAYFTAQRLQRGEDCRRMMGEIVIHGDAVGFAAQLQATAGVDKAAQRVRGIRRQHADVTRRGNRHQAVMHIMLADQRPLHFTNLFAVEQHFPLRGVGVQLLRLPVALLAHQLLLAPAAHRHHLLQVDVVLRQDNFAFARHDAHQMVELFLNRLQVIKDVRVVELKVVEDQRPRAVVNKLGALVEEGAVIFVGFNDEERAVAQARGDVEIARNAANHEPRFIAAGFKDPGCHAGSGGFAVGPGDGQHPAIAQHEVVQPLRAGHIRNIVFQHRFNARVAASHGITDDHQIRPGLQLAGVITLN